MIYYEEVDVNDAESFKYKLLDKRVFAVGKNIGKWEMLDPCGNIVAKSFGSAVVVYPNYLWDGSTVVGNFFEDDVTLEASLIHDVLYNAKKNPNNIEVPFSLWWADKVFADYLMAFYEKKKEFWKKYLISKTYKWGLWILGTPWKFGNNKYYKIKKAD